jgi:F-type H+-transporting ATPase subunit b
LMIFLLNKLFFQPVLRTLDQRKENIQGSMKQSERLSKELERMQSDFQHKLDETRKNVMEIHHSARDEAFKGREGMILQEREQLEEEMHNQSEMLQEDFASAKQRFNELTKQLSTQVSERLLN